MCMMKAFKKHIIVTVLAFVIVAILAVFALNTSFLSPVAQVAKDFKMTDVYYQILQETDNWEESDEVSIVDMSELFSRRELAWALEEVERQQPKAIGVDVVFEGLKEDSLGDDMVRQVSQEYGNIVFSYKLLDYENDSVGYTNSVHSFFALEEGNRATEGFTNMPRNLYGGIKRVLSVAQILEGQLRPSFIWQVVKMYEGREMVPLENRNLDINFNPTRFQVVSPDEIARHPELIKGRLVLFGAMQDEYDMHYTPLGKIAGVELLAYAVQTLMQQSEKRVVSGWQLGVVSFLLVLFTQCWMSGYISAVRRLRWRFVRFLLTTQVVKSFVICAWMWLLLWVSFILFCKYDISVNFAYAFSAMAFLVLAGTMYEEFKTYKKS